MLQLHRLNLDCFAIPQEPRTIPLADLQKGLTDGTLQVYTQQGVRDYLATAEGYAPKNGSTDAKEFHLRKSLQQYEELEQVYVDGGEGTELVPCFIKRTQQPEMGTLEKGAIADSFGGGSGVRIKKSGKEVKEKASAKLPACVAALGVAQAKADALLAKAGAVPTEEARPWRVQMTGVENAPKSFPWRETCWPEQSPDAGLGAITAGPSPEGYYDGVSEERRPTSQEQAQARAAYNNCVEAIIEASEDVSCLRLIVENVADSQQFEFDPRQLRLLGF